MQVLLQRLAKIEVIHLQNKIQNCVSAISRIGSISEPKTTILLFSKSKSRAFEQNWPFRRWSLTNCSQSKSSDCQSLSGLKSYRRQILFYFRKRSNLPNWNVRTRKKTITTAKKGHKNLLQKTLLQYFHLEFSGLCKMEAKFNNTRAKLVSRSISIHINPSFIDMHDCSVPN